MSRYQAPVDSRGYPLWVTSLLLSQTPLPAELFCLPKYIQKRQLNQITATNGRQWCVKYCVNRFSGIFLLSPTLQIVFCTTPFQGKYFLLERQWKAEATCNSPINFVHREGIAVMQYYFLYSSSYGNIQWPNVLCNVFTHLLIVNFSMLGSVLSTKEGFSFSYNWEKYHLKY